MNDPGAQPIDRGVRCRLCNREHPSGMTCTPALDAPVKSAQPPTLTAVLGVKLPTSSEEASTSVVFIATSELERWRRILEHLAHSLNYGAARMIGLPRAARDAASDLGELAQLMANLTHPVERREEDTEVL